MSQVLAGLAGLAAIALGSSRTDHRQHSAIWADMAEESLYRFRISMKNGNCRDAFDHLNDAAANAQVAEYAFTESLNEKQHEEYPDFPREIAPFDELTEPLSRAQELFFKTCAKKLGL
jgi:hypothetical protein